MVAHVLGLRLALLAGSVRARPAVVARRVFATLALVVAVVAVCVAVVRLGDAASGTASTLLITAGSLIVAGFLLVPLFAGAEDPLDPRRFGPLGLPPGRLAATIVLASLVSVPAMVVIAFGVAVVTAWTRQGASVPLAVFAAVLGLATCVVGARCAMAIGALALRDRRGPQLTGLLVVAASVLVVPAAVFLVSLNWSGGLPTQLTEAASALAVSPIGAAWAIPLRAGGDLARAIVIALLTLLALVLLWWWLVRRMLTTTQRPVPVRERRGLGWFAVMPGLPSGVIAARSVVYWFSDPRHLANIVIVPIASVLVVVPLLVVGVPVQTVALIPPPLMALFLGWLAHNDLAYDSTGIWMHISSGVRGIADRVGRLAPIMLISVPLLAAAITLSVWVHDRWSILPAMVGVCVSLFACGLGLGSVSSAAAPYAVTRPGDGPFEQPQRTGGGMAQALVFFGAIVVSAPALWWGWLALNRGPDYAWTALWGGIIIGAVVLLAGVIVGGVVFERRSSRLMEFAETM